MMPHVDVFSPTLQSVLSLCHDDRHTSQAALWLLCLSRALVGLGEGSGLAVATVSNQTGSYPDSPKEAQHTGAESNDLRVLGVFVAMFFGRSKAEGSM